nr:hypothetical protein [Tanacetum cinerariifolium]
MPAAGTYSVEAVRALDTHRTPIQKQPEMLLCLVRISRRYYLADEVYPTFLLDNDRGGLIRAPNPRKVKVGSHPRAPHEVPLLTLTANRVIEMDDPATTTDSSGVPPTIERSPLDFSLDVGASDQGTAASEVPPSGMCRQPLLRNLARELSWGKSFAVQLGLASTASMPEDAPTSVSDPDPLFFADPPARPSADVAQSSLGIAVAGAPESENASSPAEVESPGEDMRARFLDLQVSHDHLSQQVASLKEHVSGEEKLKASFEEFKRYKDDWVERRCAELDARLDALSIDFDEELYPHMLTAIAGRRWVIGHGLRLAAMKCDESLDMRQTFADVVHGVEHGKAQRNIESIEAYDPKAEAKFVAALQALKDLKYPLLDQLEGLKDAPIDVIMAALYLQSDTGEDAPQCMRDLRPSSSQLTIPVYPEVRD